jgi:hypothetical protein
MPLQYYFDPRIVFLLLGWRGANKKYEYFQSDFLGGVNAEKWNQPVLLLVLDSLINWSSYYLWSICPPNVISKVVPMSGSVINNMHNNHSAVYGLQLQGLILDTHNIRIPSTHVTSHKEHRSTDVGSGHWTRIWVVPWLHAQHAVIHTMSCRVRKWGWRAVILGQERRLHTHFPLDVWYAKNESTMAICKQFLSCIQNEISFSWPFTHKLTELCNYNKKFRYSFCLMVEASDHWYVLHTRSIRHTVQNITDTHNIVVLYIDGCLGFHDILVYWNESMLYNFWRSNYVQQRKTYMRKAAMVHLNCSTVHCNTLCARIAAAVWRQTRDVICDRVRWVGCSASASALVYDLGMQYPRVRHIHVNMMHIKITSFWYDIWTKFLSSIKYALHQV